MPLTTVIKELLAPRQLCVEELARQLGVSRSTLWRKLERFDRPTSACQLRQDLQDLLQVEHILRLSSAEILRLHRTILESLSSGSLAVVMQDAALREAVLLRLARDLDAQLREVGDRTPATLRIGRPAVRRSSPRPPSPTRLTLQQVLDALETEAQP